MLLDLAVREAERLALPCFDLVPAAKGDPVIAYWGGTRSDLSGRPPKPRGAIQSIQHLLSVDAALWDQLGLIDRGPFALALDSLDDDSERAVARPVSTGSLQGVKFKGGVPLKAVESLSLPPIEAIMLYGGPAVDDWLKGRGIRRWEYAELRPEEIRDYEEYFMERCPLTSDTPPFARIGGWHSLWSDDDYYTPREMRLMMWTFEEAEPWYEVFLTGLRNHSVRARIT